MAPIYTLKFKFTGIKNGKQVTGHITGNYTRIEIGQAECAELFAKYQGCHSVECLSYEVLHKLTHNYTE